ncbi:MAG: type III toxin-antitoxin system ToxN/AbiQ family toxin [Huintestinicola sp.]
MLQYYIFIPLSSYKPETYDSMYESISLKKIEDMAVSRVNNMIPVLDNTVHEIKFSLGKH